LTADSKKAYIAIDESACYSSAIWKVNRSNVSKGIVVHARIFETENTKTSPPQPYYKDLCENSGGFDGIVFLSKPAKDDFHQRYGFSKKYIVIGHPYTFPISPRQFEERDSSKVVIVARFDRIKRLELAIEIFGLVVNELPNLKMDIYGFGAREVEEELSQKIKDLNLEENIFMKGSTDNAAEVLSGGAMFMMTSASEGYGLTLQEAVCNGCPVVAFNVKYGPAAIINEGVTGYLIKDGDSKSFAKKMISLFRNEDLLRKLSENCYKDAPKFSKEVFMERWQSFTDMMTHRALQGVEE
jgi:poly(glycerol-phosphate) alpha-glucosyltransferase